MKRNNFAFFVLFLISLFFIVARRNCIVKNISNTIYFLSYSVFNLTDRVFCSFENFIKNKKSIIDLYDENVFYKQKNQKLICKLFNYSIIVGEYNELLRALKLEKIKNTMPVFARVLIRNSNEWCKCFTINKGKKDGLYNGLPVLMFCKKKDKLCVAGKIVKTHAFSSEVELITNKSYFLPVKINGVNCLSEGTNSHSLKISYIPNNISIDVGDEVVTSGLSSVFFENTLVAVVTNTFRKNLNDDFKTVSANVFFDLDTICKVIVFVPEIKI
ncbi:MAG: rod shape-determining protein MreC [Endomicrobium sp.]|jgi:rod shape-determining protein MreC|nr:rod shape-determining protein MreC [Endomicrobium sp.]